MNYSLQISFVPNQSSESPFILIHRGKKFFINSLVLKLISPKICRLIEKGTQTYEIPCIPGPINDLILILHGQTVELNSFNSNYLNFWANDLEIEMLINDTDEFLTSNTCDNLVEFTSLLIEYNFNYDKYIKIIAEKMELITNFYPIESFSSEFIGALCNCPSFDLKKYLIDILKFIDNDPLKNEWIIKCVNFSQLPSELIEEILNDHIINFNLIKTHLVSLALDLKQKRDDPVDIK